MQERASWASLQGDLDWCLPSTPIFSCYYMRFHRRTFFVTSYMIVSHHCPTIAFITLLMSTFADISIAFCHSCSCDPHLKSNIYLRYSLHIHCPDSGESLAQFCSGCEVHVNSTLEKDMRPEPVQKVKENGLTAC